MARASRSLGKNYWALFLLVLLGIVVGSFASHLTKDINYLSWLNYSINIAIGDSDKHTAVLNLAVIVIRFGVQIHITIGSVIGAIASVFIYKRL